MQIPPKNWLNPLVHIYASVAPVYGDPLAGMAAYKCRVITPNKHIGHGLWTSTRTTLERV